jgi:4-carboxymuconolactone decarboxylase
MNKRIGHAEDGKMKHCAICLGLSLLALSASGVDQTLAAETSLDTQTVSRAGSRASVRGPAEVFTGDARVDPLFPANETAQVSGAYVTFEPGARSA